MYNLVTFINIILLLSNLSTFLRIESQRQQTGRQASDETGGPVQDQASHRLHPGALSQGRQHTGAGKRKRKER